jgi:tRNA/tmRNA/rRNA uracil-C5-methylase (TrmA/RlmC/RlmD family)
VCCGTGAIGLSLSDRCGQVIGLDIVDAAVKDAQLNAVDNNITNCEFYPGRYMGLGLGFRFRV